MKIRFGKEVSKEFIKNKLNWNSESYIKTAKKFAKLSNLRQKNCFICGSKKSKKVCSIFGINYLQCIRCLHVFVDKRPSTRTLTKYYTEDINYSSNVYANKKFLQLREDIFSPKIKFIKKFVKGKNWLDVGSADGASVAAIKKEGFQTTGIEISETSRKFAKKYRKLDLYPHTLDKFAKQNNIQWDIVSLFNVIEHIPEPIAVLKTANKLLSKNGFIVIEVPNFNSVSSYVQMLNGYADRHLLPYSHIMMFTMDSAKFALRKTGFEPLATWVWGMDFIELIKRIRKIDKKFSNSRLEKKLSENLNEIQFVFDKNELGDAILMIARKK